MGIAHHEHVEAPRRMIDSDYSPSIGSKGHNEHREQQYEEQKEPIVIHYSN